MDDDDLDGVSDVWRHVKDIVKDSSKFLSSESSDSKSDGVSIKWRRVKNVITSSLEIIMFCFELTAILMPYHSCDGASKRSSHVTSILQILSMLDGDFDSLSHIWRCFRNVISFTSAYLHQILTDLFFFPFVSSPITHICINTIKIIKTNKIFLRLCNYSYLKTSNVLASTHTSTPST